MSAILNILLGSSSDRVSVSFTAANSANGIYFYYGWSAYSNGAIGARQYITGTQPGSVTGSPFFKGVQVLGIYSNSTSTNLIATRYCVLLEGSRLAGFVTGVIINGTTFTPTTGFYDDTLGATSYYFDVGSSATVISASSTAVIY